VITLLAEERARAERRLEATASVDALMKSLKSVKRKLYRINAGVQRFFEAGAAARGRHGSRQTTQAIALATALGDAADRARLLIVPASLKAQWKREWDASTHWPLVVVEARLKSARGNTRACDTGAGDRLRAAAARLERVAKYAPSCRAG